MDTIRSYITNVRGFNTVNAEYYSHIEEWNDWYKGYFAGFHSYTQYNGTKKVERKLYNLGMAKKVCEDHANLLMNEKVQISTGNDTFDEILEKILKDNNFHTRANQLVEVAYALGTGALVEYQNADGQPVIDYVRAQMIYPLAWDNGDITECAFASIRIIGGEEYYYINMHRLDDNKNYVIENKLIKKTNAEKPVEVELIGVEPEVHTNSSLPRFQIIMPNIVNNIDYDCPMGISVFANAIDELKAVDVAYDSYVNEFVLGKKRIFVKSNILNQKITSDGSIVPVFDPNDVAFYAMPDDDKNAEPIHELNMELRSEPHEAGLQRFLSLLGDKCGLGSGRYKFEQGQPQTATQVISEKSDMFQVVKKNEIILEAALIGMTKVLAEMSKVDPESLEIKVDFDDSIVEDKDSERTRMLSLVTMGKFPLAKYLVNYENYTQEEADEIEQYANSQPTVESGFGDNTEETEDNTGQAAG
jgi:A118 family predicted phage portal protein